MTLWRSPAAVGIAGGALAVVVILLVVVFGSGGSARRDTRRAVSPSPPPRPVRLADEINAAQSALDRTSSTPAALSRAAWFEQLATSTLAGEARANRLTTLDHLSPGAGAAMRANLAADAALSGLSTPPTRLPRWRVIQPPQPDTLLGYYRAAERRFRVPWEVLAAIELVETRFGRILGSSAAGAHGPMQFMPATWARFGSGSIDDQRDAIFAAARYLAANDARRDIAAALYRYNNSRDYVRAVEDYAALMRSHPRSYYGYYYWRVVYDLRRGAVVLPVGYPRARPVPVSAAAP